MCKHFDIKVMEKRHITAEVMQKRCQALQELSGLSPVTEQSEFIKRFITFVRSRLLYPVFSSLLTDFSTFADTNQTLYNRSELPSDVKDPSLTPLFVLPRENSVGLPPPSNQESFRKKPSTQTYLIYLCRYH